MTTSTAARHCRPSSQITDRVGSTPTLPQFRRPKLTYIQRPIWRLGLPQTRMTRRQIHNIVGAVSHKKLYPHIDVHCYKSHHLLCTLQDVRLESLHVSRCVRTSGENRLDDIGCGCCDLSSLYSDGTSQHGDTTWLRPDNVFVEAFRGLCQYMFVFI